MRCEFSRTWQVLSPSNASKMIQQMFACHHLPAGKIIKTQTQGSPNNTPSPFVSDHQSNPTALLSTKKDTDTKHRIFCTVFMSHVQTFDSLSVTQQHVSVQNTPSKTGNKESLKAKHSNSPPPPLTYAYTYTCMYAHTHAHTVQYCVGVCILLWLDKKKAYTFGQTENFQLRDKIPTQSYLQDLQLFWQLWLLTV